MARTRASLSINVSEGAVTGPASNKPSQAAPPPLPLPAASKPRGIELQDELLSASSGSFSSGASCTSSPTHRSKVRTSWSRRDSQGELLPAATRPPKTLARARVAYDGATPGHLAFDEGQIIEIIEQEEEEKEELSCAARFHDGAGAAPGVVLWKGRAIRDGKEFQGLFPSTHVALIKSSRRASSANLAPVFASNDSFGSTCSGGKKRQSIPKLINRECVSPEILRREKQCNVLFYSLVELVETEMRHVQDLRTVLEVFIVPFQGTFGTVLTRQVFSDWVPLLRVHEQVLLKLAEGLPDIESLSCTFSSIKCDPRVQRAIRTQREASDKGGAAAGRRDANVALLKQSFSSKDAEDAGNEGGLVTKQMTEDLKHVIRMLQHIHKEHLSDFVFLDNNQIEAWHAALQETTIALCRAMVEISDWLKLCIPCVVNQPNACKTLRQAGRAGYAVTPKHFVAQREYSERAKLNNLDLSSFLIKPMQRITKYPLLMRELVKHSDEGTPALLGAKEAFDKVSRIANNVNEIMRQHQEDHTKKAIELCQQLRPRETVQRIGLGDQSRCQRLYRYGKVTFQTLTTGLSSSRHAASAAGQDHGQIPREEDGEETGSDAPAGSTAGAPPVQLAKVQDVKTGSCYAMLFTSALFLTLRTANKWKTKTKYHIVKVIEVANITSVESMDGCLAVRTACSVLLITPLEDDVLRWQVDLQDSMRVVAADKERQNTAEAQKQHKRNLREPPQSRERRTRSVDLTLGKKAPKPVQEPGELFSSFLQELQSHTRFAAAS